MNCERKELRNAAQPYLRRFLRPLHSELNKNYLFMSVCLSPSPDVHCKGRHSASSALVLFWKAQTVLTPPESPKVNPIFSHLSTPPRPPSILRANYGSGFTFRSKHSPILFHTFPFHRPSCPCTPHLWNKKKDEPYTNPSKPVGPSAITFQKVQFNEYID